MKYALILTTILLQSVALFGQYDILYDSTFSADGIANIPYSIAAEKGAFLQSDGKILLMAEKRFAYDSTEFLVLRLNSDGTLDGTYNNSGVNTSPTLFHDFNSAPKGIMLQNDEFIVVGAAKSSNYYSDSLLLYKYLVNGVRDDQFGNSGKAILSLDSLKLSCTNFLHFNDTSLLLLIEGFYDGQDTSFNRTMIFKLSIDGRIDSSFAVNGRLELPDKANYTTLNMTVGPEGTIYLLESAYSPIFGTDTTYIMKINPDWTYTELFHVIDSTGDLYINQIFTDDDGKIILVANKFGSGFWMWRLMPNGMPDASFNRDGVFEEHFNFEIGGFNQLVNQPDGKLLFCMYGGASGVRINPNGTFDYSFDLDGLAEIIGVNDVNYNYVASSGLVLQPDGKIVFVTENENDLIKVVRVKTRP